MPKEAGSRRLRREGRENQGHSRSGPSRAGGRCKPTEAGKAGCRGHQEALGWGLPWTTLRPSGGNGAPCWGIVTGAVSTPYGRAGDALAWQFGLAAGVRGWGGAKTVLGHSSRLRACVLALHQLLGDTGGSGLLWKPCSSSVSACIPPIGANHIQGQAFGIFKIQAVPGCVAGHSGSPSR